MKYIDLHLHSYYSDGIYSPEELVKKAKKFGFSIISITDHQVVDGIKEAIKFGKKYKIKVISGIEINTKFKNYSLHLLGYCLDWQNKELNLVLEKMQAERKGNVEKCILELQKQGFKLDRDKVFNTPSKDIGFSWLVNFLKKGKNWQKIKKDFRLKKNQILTLPEIFKKYFFKNGKSILPSSEISFEKAVKLIKKTGGIVVLAHPSQQLSWRDDWLFPILKKKGLQGIEAISAHHNWQNIEHYQKIARELKFLTTIGSDYHGDLPEEWRFPVRGLWQYFKVGIDRKVLKRIKNVFLNRF